MARTDLVMSSFWTRFKDMESVYRPIEKVTHSCNSWNYCSSCYSICLISTKRACQSHFSHYGQIILSNWKSSNHNGDYSCQTAGLQGRRTGARLRLANVIIGVRSVE